MKNKDILKAAYELQCLCEVIDCRDCPMVFYSGRGKLALCSLKNYHPCEWDLPEEDDEDEDADEIHYHR